MKVAIAIITALFIHIQVSYAQTLCPDGTYVGGDTCKMAPDGSYVGGTPQIAPDGSYVGGTPQITPNGSYVGGTSTDGSGW